METRASDEVVAFHRSVRDLCVERLRDALGHGTALFDRQLRNSRWEGTHGTEDLTSTAICLVGLHRAAIEPARVGLDVQRTVDALAAVARRRRYAGGLGLVLWANAVWDVLPLEALLDRTGMTLADPEALVAGLTTMETSWLASGLVHEERRSGHALARRGLDAARREILSRHRPDTRLFVHASDRAPLAHRVRRWVANFADQIYAVQALALIGFARRDDGAVAVAGAAARRLVELQGELGQWWWHYDPRDGDVAQRFPVYSVHQHAMAPMALMTLAAAERTSHGRAIDRSHAWLARNELGVGMLDREAGTIWRDIEIDEREAEQLLRHARSVLGWRAARDGVPRRRLKLNRETRPYEWAWCLFAGAIAAGGERERHVI